MPQIQAALEKLKEAMLAAARNLEFETAAALRDEVYELERELRKKVDGQPVGTILENLSPDVKVGAVASRPSKGGAKPGQVGYQNPRGRKGR